MHTSLLCRVSGRYPKYGMPNGCRLASDSSTKTQERTRTTVESVRSRVRSLPLLWVRLLLFFLSSPLLVLRGKGKERTAESFSRYCMLYSRTAIISIGCGLSCSDMCVFLICGPGLATPGMIIVAVQRRSLLRACSSDRQSGCSCSR